ncbi:MAG TPA: hypothetical protein VFC23_06030 [Thermoanaerobaculia bacterium]|nr:hypothetical protein [Thermoanaerobaculia bacterium]
MRSATVRTLLALLLFSSWLALLFLGLALGGAVHLLLVGGLGLFPWRELRGLEGGTTGTSGTPGTR